MTVDSTSVEIRLAELYQITLTSINNVQAFFTSNQKDIIYDSTSYQAIPIKRSPISYTTDMQVDRVDISIGLSGVTIGDRSFTMYEILRRDYLRSAHVKILLVDPDKLNDEDILFEGWVTGDIGYDAGILGLGVNSILDKLNEKYPKILYTETCNHQLYSTYCGLDSTSWEEYDDVGIGSDLNTIISPVFAYSNQSSGYWNKGKITIIESGSDNEGISRTIKSHSDGSVELLTPLDDSPVLNEEFKVIPGCDKTGTTCDSKFSNYVNFLGFEYIPKAETPLLPT